MLTELTPEQAANLQAELIRGVEAGPYRELGYWDKFTPEPGWELVDYMKSTRVKIKARNEEMGLFVKMYAPITAGYARLMYDALVEVSNLQTSPLILAPIAIAETALFFPLGSFAFKAVISDFFEKEDLQKISSIAKKYGIRTLGRFGGIDFVDIENYSFAVDPFDDNDMYIINWD